jgi:hypothetical protein
MCKHWDLGCINKNSSTSGKPLPKPNTASNYIQQLVNSANSGDVDNDSQSDSLWFGQLCSRSHGNLKFQVGIAVIIV